MTTYREGLPPITTGFAVLDRALRGGFRPECMHVFAGRTASAKSTVVTNIARRVALAGRNVLLFKLGPNVVVCYVCRAWHSGFDPAPKHPAFDREIEERLKFGEQAVMGKPMREGGTAGAPEPEH